MATKKNKNNPVQPHFEVTMLKLIILFVVLLIPLSAVLVFSFSQPFSLMKVSRVEIEKTQPVKTTEKQVNFEAPLPTNRMGDLSNVSQDKLDSLFNNLKD
jgi:cell division septal protein FtsQ